MSLADEMARLQARPEPAPGIEEAPPAAPVAPAAVAPLPAAAAPAAVAAPVVAQPGAVPAGSIAAPGVTPIDPAQAAAVALQTGEAPPQTMEEALAQLEKARTVARDHQGATATERARARAAEQAAREQFAENQRMQQNFQTLMAAIVAQQAGGGATAPQPQPQPFALPTPQELEADPMSALKKLAAFANAALQERTDQAAAAHDQQQRQQQAQHLQVQEAHAISAIATNLRTYEEEYKQAQPDYDEAMTFYVDARAKHMQTLYPGVDPQVLWRNVLNETLTSAARALQANQNPAALLYQAAGQLGYQRKLAPPVVPAALPGAPITVDPNNPLASLQAGLAAAQTLSGGGSGGAGEGEVSLTEGVKLTGAAFDSWKTKFLSQQLGRRYG